MDLFGPSRTMSLGGNYYGLVIVDDYSRFTLTFFIATKMKFTMSLKDLSNLFRMRRIAVFHPLNLTMGKNFRMRSLTDFAVNWELNTTSQHQELHNRMEL